MRSDRFQIANPAIPVVILLALVGCLFLGVSATERNAVWLALGFLSIVACALALAFKEKTWMLIPLAGAFGGQLPFLPLPFSPAQLAVVAVFGLTFVFYALKLPLYRTRIDRLDVILLLNMLYLLTVFLRNPVGLKVLNTELVGGKPYVEVAIALMVWFILGKVRLSPKLAPWFPFILFSGSLLGGLITLFTWYVPSSVPYIARFYGGISVSTYLDSEAGNTASSEDRVIPMADLGQSLIPLLCGYFRPLTLINPLHVLRCGLFVLSIYFILKSGFRSSLFQAGLVFLIATILRSGLRDAITAGFVGLVAMIFMVMMSFAGLQLPYTFERALSIIPGMKVSETAEIAASSSDEWRHTMWRQVLTEPQWIRNKLLGDGFGFKRSDLELMMEAKMGGTGFYGNSDPTLSQKIQGSYHNGPLTAIRFVGVVGLLLYMVMLIYRAIYACRLYKDARNTPYGVLGLICAATSVYHPIGFVFIFGAYNVELPGVIFSIAYMRLYRNSLDQYLKGDVKEEAPPKPKERTRERIYVPMAMRNLERGQEAIAHARRIRGEKPVPGVPVLRIPGDSKKS